MAVSAYAGRPIKIFAIGNSFTVDAVQDQLVPLAASDSVTIEVSFPYRGGTSLKEHWQFIQSDTAIYNYRKNIGGKVHRLGRKSMSEALRDDSYDWVVLQEYNRGSDDKDSYMPYLKNIMDWVKTTAREPEKIRFALYMTWAYDADSGNDKFEKYGRDEERMYREVVAATRKAAADAGIDVIIPAGTAVQNLRGTFYGDRMTRDGLHMNMNRGRYVLACTWYEALTGRPVLGLPYHPKELTPYQAAVCRAAAHKAIRNPFEVSAMDEFDTDPLYAAFGDSLPARFEVGTTLGTVGGFGKLDRHAIRRLANSNIRQLEISLTGLVNGPDAMSNKELAGRLAKVKEWCDRYGVNVRSIHMPYHPEADPSEPDEKKRRVAEKNIRGYLGAVKVLEPEYILFHPSVSDPEPGQRPERIAALAKTVRNINPAVKAMGANILIENLRGPQLTRKNGRERGLGRTVEEMQAIMAAMPDDVYVCIDLNHIDHPEELIKAMGSRIRSLHVADSDGKADRHWMPGKGKNNWPAIIDALYSVGYTGPWLYEIKPEEIEGRSAYGLLVSNYEWIYDSYLNTLLNDHE